MLNIHRITLAPTLASMALSAENALGGVERSLVLETSMWETSVQETSIRLLRCLNTFNQKLEAAYYNQESVVDDALYDRLRLMEENINSQHARENHQERAGYHNTSNQPESIANGVQDTQSHPQSHPQSQPEPEPEPEPKPKPQTVTSNRVGAPPATRNLLTHRKQMLSLRSLKDHTDVIRFYKSAHKKIKMQSQDDKGMRLRSAGSSPIPSLGSVAWIAEPKVDGLTLRITYVDGHLKESALRGDRWKGDNVTYHVRNIHAIPQQLVGNVPSVIDVIGEVYIPVSQELSASLPDGDGQAHERGMLSNRSESDRSKNSKDNQAKKDQDTASLPSLFARHSSEMSKNDINPERNALVIKGKNRRNAASGIMHWTHERVRDFCEDGAGNSGATSDSHHRSLPLAFVFHGIGYSEPLANLGAEHYFTQRMWARSQGFEVIEDCAECIGIDSIEAFFRGAHDHRKQKWHYETDGIVFKIDNIAMREYLNRESGSSARPYPSWAFAYKHPHNPVVTTLRTISYSVGKTGALTPMAYFDPVDIDGARIAQASLSNMDKLRELRAGEGHQVMVARMGGVIPKVERALDPKDTPITYPIVCPSCGARVVSHNPLLLEPYEVKSLDVASQLYCSRPVGCRDALASRMHFMCSRGLLNIQSLGARIITLLIDQGLIHSLEDIFSLDYQKLKNIPTMGTKTISKIQSEIEQARTQRMSLAMLLNIQGVPSLGGSVADALNQAFFSWQRFAQVVLDSTVSKDRLVTILADVPLNVTHRKVSRRIGEKTASNIVYSLMREDIRSVLQGVARTCVVHPMNIRLVSHNPNSAHNDYHDNHWWKELHRSSWWQQFGTDIISDQDSNDADPIINDFALAVSPYDPIIATWHHTWQSIRHCVREINPSSPVT